MTSLGHTSEQSRTDRIRTFLSKYSTALTSGVLLLVAVVAALLSGSLRLETRSAWLDAIAIAAGVGAVVNLFRSQLRIAGSAPLDGGPYLPMRVIALLTLCGLVAAWVYAAVDPQGSVKVAAVLTLALGAAFASGGFGGFLFGLPRFAYGDGTRYTPSTNLDQIADWLTKIIVGVGLIELKALGPKLEALAAYVAPACTPAHCHDAPTSTVLVFGAICGFFYVYVWTRLQFARLAAKADKATFEDVNSIEQKAKETASTLGVGGSAKSPAPGAANAGLSTVHAPAAAAGGGGGLLSPGGASGDDHAETSSADNDPNKGRFGGSANVNGRVLRAQFTPSQLLKDYVTIQLTVSSTIPERPVTGRVIFYLHPSFPKDVQEVDAVNGVAELVVTAWGAFTVGARIVNENLPLELDLSEHPEAPVGFRDR